MEGKKDISSFKLEGIANLAEVILKTSYGRERTIINPEESMYKRNHKGVFSTIFLDVSGYL